MPISKIGAGPEMDGHFAVHLIAPWPMSWLLGNALEHTAHHVAQAPDGELAAIQDHLEAEFPEIIQKVKLTDCLRILAFCKLYDYEQHRWLDYAGQPMSEDRSNSEIVLAPGIFAGTVNDGGKGGKSMNVA